ncbi:MAG: thioesterase family protein [Bacteroidota bacterium]
MFADHINYRVCYGDTDQMGYMYYGNYARIYEIARTEALRKIGYKYKKMEEEGIMMPVYENYTKYLLPALYDDLLTIKVSIKTLPSFRCVFDYEIFNESGKLLNIGQTTLVFSRIADGKLCRPPQYLMELLGKYFE